jgi:DNA primase
VTWDEVEGKIDIQDFRIGNMPERVRNKGDLFAALLASENRVKPEVFL